ncbi:hypothetical protein O3P69_000479 [Scylla paramamosain]|uniref:Insulin gene enhancer protein ISL-1 n=1 Tax=Scylla paramamosain TaxID=85552 RepID=A0AAW0UTC4_SCYPA
MRTVQEEGTPAAYLTRMEWVKMAPTLARLEEDAPYISGRRQGLALTGSHWLSLTPPLTPDWRTVGESCSVIGQKAARHAQRRPMGRPGGVALPSLPRRVCVCASGVSVIWLCPIVGVRRRLAAAATGSVAATVVMTEAIKAERAGRAAVCIGCGAIIHDQYILRVAPDMEWHAACLKCVDCHQFLDEYCTCFVRDGKTYCKRDYVRLFGAKCDKCGRMFEKTDMVMRARTKIYHLDCFRCSTCRKQLLPGDEFALREDGLYCRYDFDLFEKKANAENNNTTNINNNNNELKGEGKPLRKERREGKATRVRTVLNEKQLHTLRTCYAANPRPDALMKEQLVEMTGLSPRVVRVWFQNKRCKDKKKAMFLKQAAQQHEKSGRFGTYSVMQGIPLVASPPVQTDPPSAPLDVTAYQPPWKSLTEFALTHDLDRLDPTTPQYQHMIQQMHGYGLDHETGLPHLQLPQYMEEGGPMGHPYGHPPSNPSAQYPGTPSELSSTSSD